MSLADKILGRPLAIEERSKESLSIWTGVPVLGLDGLASTGYGPEAALTILVPLGLVGLPARESKRRPAARAASDGGVVEPYSRR